MHGGIERAGALRSRWVRRCGVTIASAAVAAVLVSCASGAASTRPVATAETTTAPTSAEKAKSAMSDNERIYATYLETLTPAQKEQRGALSPEVLTTQSDAEIAKTFTITAAEITSPDGKIDPTKFAEAWAARQQGLIDAGNSVKELDKWGGLANYNMDMCTKIANKYVPVITEALYGHDVADKVSMANSCFKSALIDSLISDPAQKEKPERYSATVIPFKDTTPNIAPNPDGSFNVSLREITADNFPVELVQQAISVEGTQAYSESNWKIVVKVNNTTGAVTIVDSQWS